MSVGIGDLQCSGADREPAERHFQEGSKNQRQRHSNGVAERDPRFHLSAIKVSYFAPVFTPRVG
jgi:hypothetical protein